MSFFLLVFLSTAIFVSIILLLIGLLIFVETKVQRQGHCQVHINDDKKMLDVRVGQNLLKILTEKKIFLPSACGGKGTCGVCKCQILKGAGEVLPTEKPFLSRQEIKSFFRLACQVKIRENLQIIIPDEIFNIKQYQCTVRSNRNVSTFIKELVLELPSDPFDFKPGAYVQVNIPPYQIKFSDYIIEAKYRADWDKEALLDLRAENDESLAKAYSVANHPAEKGIIILNVRIAPPPSGDKSLPPGIASSYIFNLKPGDKVSISGPYGDFFIKDTQKEKIYIGGGAGMAPLRSHLFFIFQTLKTKDQKISYWYGARSKRELFYTKEFLEIQKNFPNFHYQVALSEPLPEDEWEGPTGFIHQVLFDKYLKNHPEPEEIEYYLCGPPLMIEALQNMLDQLGVPADMISFDSFG